MGGSKDLTRFKALSFDCLGTLIDWEAGLATALAGAIVSKLPAGHRYADDPTLAAQRFSELSDALEVAEPRTIYSENLRRSLRALAAEAGVAVTAAEEAAMGAAPGSWAPFPDTAAGLAVLRRRYGRLAILSNIDNANIARTVGQQLGDGLFDAVYTAEDIGSYKPAAANFRHLFSRLAADLGVDAEAGELLHVARSLPADHVPAKELGLPSVWIARGGDAAAAYGLGGDYAGLHAAGKLAFGWKFDSLADFAAEVERQFAARGSESEA